jgi:hypothetical protein
MIASATTLFTIVPDCAGIADAYGEWDVVSAVPLPANENAFMPQGIHKLRYHVKRDGQEVVTADSLAELKSKMGKVRR